MTESTEYTTKSSLRDTHVSWSFNRDVKVNLGDIHLENTRHTVRERESLADTMTSVYSAGKEKRENRAKPNSSCNSRSLILHSFIAQWLLTTSGSVAVVHLFLPDSQFPDTLESNVVILETMKPSYSASSLTLFLWIRFKEVKSQSECNLILFPLERRQFKVFDSRG